MWLGPSHFPFHFALKSLWSCALECEQLWPNSWEWVCNNLSLYCYTQVRWMYDHVKWSDVTRNNLFMQKMMICHIFMLISWTLCVHVLTLLNIFQSNSWSSDPSYLVTIDWNIELLERRNYDIADLLILFSKIKAWLSSCSFLYVSLKSWSNARL